MLEGRLGQMLGMAGQVDLAVAAEDASVRRDQDGRVVAFGFAGLDRQLGIAEIETDAESGRRLEERPCRRVGHLALEESIDLALILHPPARKERGEGELGKDHELRAGLMRLAQ